jgi:hypothetical protein
VEHCLQGMESRISDDVNNDLLKEFTTFEVDIALAQVHPLKSSGLGGFAACFYQRLWETV